MTIRPDFSVTTTKSIFLIGTRGVYVSGASLTAAGGLTVTAGTIELGAQTSFLGTDVTLSLNGLNPNGESWLSIHDEAVLRTHDQRAVQVTGSGRTDDFLDFGDSMLDGVWTISGDSSGTFTHSNLNVVFSSIEQVLAGNGDDTVILRNGASIDWIRMGGGVNIADASALSSPAYWLFSKTFFM